MLIHATFIHSFPKATMEIFVNYFILTIMHLDMEYLGHDIIVCSYHDDAMCLAQAYSQFSVSHVKFHGQFHQEHCHLC